MKSIELKSLLGFIRSKLKIVTSLTQNISPPLYAFFFVAEHGRAIFIQL